MSEQDEGFLNRWSRRKQDAAKDAAESAAKEGAEADAEKSEIAAAADPGAAAEGAEEEFDISKLPPIDSITASTDIRAFLSKGVPAALTQAALRRAWSADPAIRDYIGLSEYSWDFNAPGQYGFGTLDPTLNVQDMVADVFGKVKQAVSETETLVERVESPAAQTPSATAQADEPGTADARIEDEGAKIESGEAAAHSESDSGDISAQSAAAPQQPESESEPAFAPVRRHGSALPD